MKNQTHDVFVSYCGADLSAVLEIVERLQREGYKCWLADRDMPLYKSFSRAIAEAISTCQQVVVVMSKSACEALWVERECLFADCKNKPLHIVRIEEVELPIYLIERHAIDVGSARGMQQLIRDLECNPPQRRCYRTGGAA